jgi:hypothetical protein
MYITLICACRTWKPRTKKIVILSAAKDLLFLRARKRKQVPRFTQNCGAERKRDRIINVSAVGAMGN